MAGIYAQFPSVQEMGLRSQRHFPLFLSSPFMCATTARKGGQRGQLEAALLRE